jgi:hypothetical protein
MIWYQMLARMGQYVHSGYFRLSERIALSEMQQGDFILVKAYVMQAKGHHIEWNSQEIGN